MRVDADLLSCCFATNKVDPFTKLENYLIAKAKSSDLQLNILATKNFLDSKKITAESVELAQQFIALERINDENRCSDESSIILKNLFDLMVKYGRDPFGQVGYKKILSYLIIEQLKKRVIECIGDLIKQIMHRRDLGVEEKALYYIETSGFDCSAGYVLIEAEDKETFISSLPCMIEKKLKNETLHPQIVYYALARAVRDQGIDLYIDESGQYVTEMSTIDDHFSHYLDEPCKALQESELKAPLEKAIEILSTVKISNQLFKEKSQVYPASLRMNYFILCERLFSNGREKVLKYIYNTVSSKMHDEFWKNQAMLSRSRSSDLINPYNN